MTNCVFCKIISGEIPAEIVYKDEKAFAMLDINPRAPGHTMVIPVTHAETLLELPDDEISHFFKAVKRVTAMINRALSPDGFTLGINHGKVSGQAVDHLHFHIIPRYRNDKGTPLHGIVDNPPKESLEEIRRKITDTRP